MDLKQHHEIKEKIIHQLPMNNTKNREDYIQKKLHFSGNI